MKSLDSVARMDADARRHIGAWPMLWIGLFALIGLLDARHRYLNPSRSPDFGIENDVPHVADVICAAHDFAKARVAAQN